MKLNPTNLFRTARRRTSLVVAIASLATLAFAGSASAQVTAPNLGTADSFALLAGTGISVAGAPNTTTVCGDIGISPNTVASFTGSANVNQTCGGAQYFGTGGVSAGAQDDVFSTTDGAYAFQTHFAQTGAGTDLGAVEIGGRTLTPGIWDAGVAGMTTGGGPNALQISAGATLTLDFQGNPNAVFILRGASVLTGAGAAVTGINTGGGTYGCNVYWRLSNNASASVTLGANTAFRGTTMSPGSATLINGTTVQGRLLTDEAITLDTNTINRQQSCAAAVVDSGNGLDRDNPTPTPTPTPTPEGEGTPSDSTDGTSTDTTPTTSPPAVAPRRLTRREWELRRAAAARGARRRAIARDRRRAAVRRAQGQPTSPPYRRTGGGFTG